MFELSTEKLILSPSASEATIAPSGIAVWFSSAKNLFAKFVICGVLSFRFVTTMIIFCSVVKTPSETDKVAV